MDKKSNKKVDSKKVTMSTNQKIIDKIILKNKEKLDRSILKDINVEKFSLKNREENTVFYLRKKPRIKSKDSTNNGSLGKKIISENISNLGEFPHDKEKIRKGLDVGSEEKEAKKSKGFGRYKKDISKTDASSLSTKDLIESKGFDEIVSEIDRIIEYDSQSKTEGEKEGIDERDIKIDAEKQPSTVEDVISEDNKDISEGSSADNLPGFKDISEKKIPVSDAVPSESDRLKDGEVRDVLIDKEAGKKEVKARKKELKARKKEFKARKKEVEVGKKGFRSGRKDVGVSGKRFFFKRRKSSDVGVVGSKREGVELEEGVVSPMFHVDNIPLSDDVNEDEAKYLDEKIKVYSEKDKSIDEVDQVASKAVELAKEHIKDKSMKVPEDLVSDKKTNKLDIIAPVESTPDEEKNFENEHVFFDEEESSSKGWSPRISKPEKKSEMSQTITQDEIDSGNLKDVGYLELPNDVLKTDSVKLSDLGFSENQWEELDFYALNEPFAYVEILREKDTLDKCYFLVEIALTKEEEKTLVFILDTMSSLSFDTIEMEEKGYEEYLNERLEKIIQEYNIKLSGESKKKIFYYIGKSSLGLGKIDPLMKDPNIEDISCDGACVPVFLYHRKFGSLKSNVRFNDEEELSSFVHRLAQKSGKHISIAEPMLDATMPDGSRIQMTLSDEITAKGSTFTIRKFRADPFSPPDLIEFNTMSSEMVAYMWIAVENGINTLFAGGTASGKTTALNALSLFIPRESKIVSIEETREINLPHPNWIPGVARSGFGEVVAGKSIGEIDMYDLMKAALRQRPEYILVGEIRGREAYVLFQAMATGHATYSTVHADSAQSLIHRLEGKPVNIPRVMLQSLDVVCLHVITRVKNMRARRCKQIIEIIDIDPTTKEILTNEVFRWDPVEDRFIYSGKSYVLERVRAEKDLNREEMTQEINNRRKIVEWMNTNNIREFREVAKIVAQYTENPDETLKQIEKDVK